MANTEQFVEEYNDLVVGDEATSHFQLIHMGTEEAWGTFAVPADPARIVEQIGSLAHDLPTGKHALKLQAISNKSNAVRGQIALTIEGRSAAAKNAGKEAMEMAKATSLHVSTMDVQLSTMSRRLEESQERCRVAEARAGDSIADVYKMGDIVNNMILKEKEAQFDYAEREARMENMKVIAQTFAPILMQAVTIGSEILEIKVDSWRRNAKREAEEAEKTAEAKRQEKSSPLKTEVRVESETAN